MKRKTSIIIIVILVAVGLLAAFLLGAFKGLGLAPNKTIAGLSQSSVIAEEQSEFGPGLIAAVDKELSKPITVSETYQSFTNIDLQTSAIGNVTLKEGDKFAVKGENDEKHGGLSVKLEGDTLKVSSAEPVDTDVMVVTSTAAKNNSFVEITYPKGTKLGTVKLSNSAGDIDLASLACKDVSISLDAGNATASGLSFTDKCEAKNSAGNVSLGLSMKKSELSYDLRTSAGKVTVDGKNTSVHETGGTNGSKTSLYAETEAGNVIVAFAK
jgi:hypothetical protein